jgi:hypothetical protein
LLFCISCNVCLRGMSAQDVLRHGQVEIAGQLFDEMGLGLEQGLGCLFRFCQLE